MKKRLGLFRLFKETSWTDHIIQFFIVLLSITIAFNLESYRKNVNDRKEELINMHNLLEELQKDIYYFDGIISHNTGQFELVQYFQDEQLERIPLDDDNFRKLTGNVDDDEKFSPMDITYTSMVNSGKLSSIQNHDIRVKVIELYHRTYKLVYDEEKDYRSRIKSASILKSDITYWDKTTNQNIIKYPAFNRYLDAEKSICIKKDQFYVYVKEKCEELQELIKKEIEK